MKIKRRKTKPILIIACIVLSLYALTMVFPLYFVLVNSLKRPSQFYDNPWSLTKVLYLANYLRLKNLGVGDVSLPRMYLNSIILTTSAMIISTTATIIVGYTLARFNFRGRNILVAIGIGAMLIPDLGSRAVIYKMYVDLKMIDTWFILIQYAQPFGLMFLISYSFYLGVSKTYAEAAKIDGASEMQILLRIMVPIAKGVISMTMVMNAIAAWNDFYTPYMYLPSVKTLALGIQELSEEAQTYSNYTELFAAMIASTTPVLIVFVLMRKTIIYNTFAGGIKG